MVRLDKFKVTDEVYSELKLLGRQYSHYIKMRVESKLEIYALALDGIPIISSSTPSTKMLVLESVRVLKEIEKTITLILT